VAPVTADQLKLTEDIVDTPQLIVALKIGLTVMLSVVVVAHCPADGVNVYKVVVVLFNAGLQVPAIPFEEVVGNAANAAPVHIAATGLKVGVEFGVTVMLRVVVVAHCPAAGVNVYKVEVVLFNAGLHDPVIPFKEVVGKAANAVPAHIAAMGLNVGVVFEVTVMLRVVVVAHCPAAGVNVYNVVIMLFSAGLQVPVIPFKEVVGNAANEAPAQIAATGLKVGVVFGLTVMPSVAFVAHCPAVGVNV
jgi:phosphate starvation-inducible membrane PsiE